MKMILSLALLVAAPVFGMEWWNNRDATQPVAQCGVSMCCRIQEEDITHSLAQSWQDVEPYKNTVFFPFFEKAGFKKDYLEERWDVVKDFYNTKQPSIALLQLYEEPVGFLTVESNGENMLLYTSPVLIEKEEIDPMLSSVAKDLFPEVENCYCMVDKSSEPLKKFVESLHFKQVSKKSCPITPNEQFIKGLSYWMFVKKLNN